MSPSAEYRINLLSVTLVDNVKQSQFMTQRGARSYGQSALGIYPYFEPRSGHFRRGASNDQSTKANFEFRGQTLTSPTPSHPVNNTATGAQGTEAARPARFRLD